MNVREQISRLGVTNVISREEVVAHLIDRDEVLRILDVDGLSNHQMMVESENDVLRQRMNLLERAK